MKRILINATHNEEIRVALCKDNHLYDFDLENRTREQKKANIYKGHITRIEPSLEAVFVEYGSARQGFLPLREIAPSYLSGSSRDDIRKVIKEGDELIIQVEKEERGNKGAAISTFISLAGRYLVLMPNNAKGGGISRQISGKVRDDMRQIISDLNIPKGMSVIVRTAGIGKLYEDLRTDLDHLLDIWSNIQHKAHHEPSPCLLYQEAGVVTRAVRDYLRDDIGEVWIDSEHAYNEAASFISAVMPSQMGKLRKYTDYEPLFVRFGVEQQIETAYQREVRLPSGGSIVIDQTEALVSIDINSSKSTKGSDVAETAFHTNLEAADEIARQLRLRDMGGLIVIDFIDMADARHQKEVEKRLIDATRYDRARVQFAEISKFGLMQMSRQRLRPSLEEATGYICPRCHGNGMIRDVRSLALSIMRQIEQLALKNRSGEVQAEVPTEIAAFLLNEKRESLVYLEQDSGTRITILPHAHLESPNFTLHFNPDGFAPASYDRITDAEEQQNIDRGYDVNWQTKQPIPTGDTNHWQSSKAQDKAYHKAVEHKNQDKTQESKAQDKAQDSRPTHHKATANSTPQAESVAVAWLSNLFAPKQQAALAPSLHSHDVAAAIEAIVNTGAQSLGVAGHAYLPSAQNMASDTTPIKKDERKKDDTAPQSKAYNKEHKADDKSEKDNKAYKSAYKSDKGYKYNDRPAKDKNALDKTTQDKNKAYDKSADKNTKADKNAPQDKYPKRQAGSHRPLREAIERGEPVQLDTKPSEGHAKEQLKHEQKARPETTLETRLDGTDTAEQVVSPIAAVAPKADKNKITMHIKRLDNTNPTVGVVRLSLDNTSSDVVLDNVVLDNAALDNVSPTHTSSSTATQAVNTQADTQQSTQETTTKETITQETVSQKAVAQEAVSQATTQETATPTATDMHGDIEHLDNTHTLSNDSDNNSDNHTAVATQPAQNKTASHAQHHRLDHNLLVKLIAQTGRAKNDPRLIKQALNPTAITGSAGAFIKATLDNADSCLAQDGFVACFVRAINQQKGLTEDFDFANFGFAPLTQAYLSQFNNQIIGRGNFSTIAGKTAIAATTPSPRAKNDPRGEHPALLAPSTQAITSEQPTAVQLVADDKLDAPSAPTKPPSKTDTVFDKDTHTDKQVNEQAQAHDEQGEQGDKDSTAIQEPPTQAQSSPVQAVMQDTDPSDKRQAVIQAVHENSLADTPNHDDSHSDNSSNQDLDNRNDKVTPERYRHMIETIVEQMLPASGFLQLGAKKTPKKASTAKKSVKIAIKTPKTDKKPKVEVKKRSKNDKVAEADGTADIHDTAVNTPTADS